MLLVQNRRTYQSEVLQDSDRPRGNFCLCGLEQLLHRQLETRKRAIRPGTLRLRDLRVDQRVVDPDGLEYLGQVAYATGEVAAVCDWGRQPCGRPKTMQVE